VVAEMSANHHQSLQNAVELVHAAKESGADALKVQTYTPDTMTIRSDREAFRISGGTWAGQSLYGLYQQAYTPWEWQPRLKEEAEKLDMVFFSTPFDETAVDFLHEMGVPAFKVASFELVDIPLIRYMAQKGRPVILSTGMATLREIAEAVGTIRDSGNKEMILLKCVSAYPADPEDMNLRTIPHLSETFGLPVGISDHTLGHEIALAGVTLGALVVEKHFTLSRKEKGPDSAFSMEPDEFKTMVQGIRIVEKALGSVSYEPTEGELQNRIFRRSLFVVEDVRAGETVTTKNVRSIRPGSGLHPRYLLQVMGRNFKKDVKKGTPLSWDLI